MATNAVTDPGSTSVWRDDRVDPLSWRWHGPALGIAAAMALATAIVALSDGLSVRDTDKMLSARSAGLIGAVIFFVILDLLPRAIKRGGRIDVAIVTVARERWNRRRFAAVLLGLAVVLRHVPVVPEPQGLPAVPDRPGLRPGPAVARPQLLLRPRPRPAAPRPARDRHRRAGAVVGLPLLPRVRADLARRGADRVRQPDPRALVRDRARHQLDAGHRLLPDHPVARADLRGARPLRDAAGDRHVRAPAGADLRAPRGAGRRRRAEHCRVRVAARLRRVHGGVDRPAAEGQPRPALRAVDVPRPDDGRHAVLRLALRGRRPRGPPDRRDRRARSPAWPPATCGSRSRCAGAR